MRNALKRWARRRLIDITGVSASDPPRYANHVITYHRIGQGDEASCVSPAAFRAQMRFLASSCKVVGPSETGADARAAPNAASVRITIDDGDISALGVAAPVLADLKLPATLFIPTDGIGKPGRLCELDIRRLSDVGFSIGSHSCSHTSMGSLSVAECRRECVESRRVLEDITGRAVDLFAYPFGTLVDFGQQSEQAVAAAGYKWAFTSQHGPVSAETHPLRIPRVKIENGDSLDMFARIVEGALDRWVWIDRHFWWLQRGAHRRPITS
jgi:peptidoglycan/xylan/chitin deacetylase (PgdA/CDA1 family)